MSISMIDQVDDALICPVGTTYDTVMSLYTLRMLVLSQQ